MYLKNRVEKTVVIGIMTFGGLLVSLPFVWMILSSLKNEREVLNIPPTLFPNEPTIEHYINLFQNLNFDVYLINTLILVFFFHGRAIFKHNGWLWFWKISI